MDKTHANWTVLIVDDVRATRALLRALLRDNGVGNVLEAENGVEALRILQSRRVDVIVTDLAMDAMDGLQLTRKLRQPHGKNAFVPVMMISGHEEAKHVKAAMEAGVACFMKKPLAAGPFMARLRSLVLQPRNAVKAAAYWGPDRRTRELPVRQDRRSDDEFDLDALPQPGGAPA